MTLNFISSAGDFASIAFSAIRIAFSSIIKLNAKNVDRITHVIYKYVWHIP